MLLAFTVNNTNVFNLLEYVTLRFILFLGIIDSLVRHLFFAYCLGIIRSLKDRYIILYERLLCEVLLPH
jgi:hypothetical protein